MSVANSILRPKINESHDQSDNIKLMTKKAPPGSPNAIPVIPLNPKPTAAASSAANWIKTTNQKLYEMKISKLDTLILQF